MFLRKLRVHKDGKEHGYWSLVETVRTADGPRQRTLCYLGELNGSAHARWQKTVEVFNEHGESTQLKLFPSEAEVPDDPNVARVRLKKVRVERARRFGDCYLGLELWKRLGLDEFFAQHLDGDDADVAWSRVAAVLAINRLCAPGSELAVDQHWYPSTALDDLLHIAKGKINDTRLYRCLDRLLPLKAKLEQQELWQRAQDCLRGTKPCRRNQPIRLPAPWSGQMRVLQRETDSRETQRKKEDVSKILVLQQGLQQPVQRQRGKD